MLLFFQKLGSMFQSNQPDVVSRSLVGQCLYLIVEAGPTHIQQVAEHVDVEAWVVHIVFDALFDGCNEFPVQVVGAVDAIRIVLLVVQVQAGIFVAQQCPVSQQVGNVCSQYTDIEGFHNIFIRSALQSLDDILVGIQCCEQDDGDM